MKEEHISLKFSGFRGKYRTGYSREDEAPTMPL